MNKLNKWVIKKLGGNVDIPPRLPQPTIIRTDTELLRASASVEIEERVPIEAIKRDVAHHLTQELLEQNLIMFDVHDDYEGFPPRKRLFGTVSVAIPKSYISSL